MKRAAPIPLLLSFAGIESAGASLVLYLSLRWWGAPVERGGFMWLAACCVLIYVPRRLWLGLPEGVRWESAGELLETGVVPELYEMAVLTLVIWLCHSVFRISWLKVPE